MVADGARVLGVVELRDVVKGGIRERFAELRQMGIKTVMVTGEAAMLTTEDRFSVLLLMAKAGAVTASPVSVTVKGLFVGVGSGPNHSCRTPSQLLLTYSTLVQRRNISEYSAGSASRRSSSVRVSICVMREPSCDTIVLISAMSM